MSQALRDQRLAPDAIRAAKAAHPERRARDLAADLRISEAELVAAGCGAEAVRLSGPFSEIVLALSELGRVMALTRNESVVHEKVGAYANISFTGHGGLVLNNEIDLRLFLGNWASAFAVTESVRSGVRQSLQFFDGAGTAIHKVYLRGESDAAAYHALVARFRNADQSPAQSVAPIAPAAPDRPDTEIDVAGLRGAWAALQDTHDFFPLLKKHKVGRLQALRLGGPDFVEEVSPVTLTAVLEMAAVCAVPIMVFVGNRGIIQIHTGLVARIEPRGPWINVLDEGFNLHARTDHVARAFVVRKPTSDGVVTALEFFDAAGTQIVQMFGERKPGKAELPAWRDLVRDLTIAHRLAA